MVHKFLMYVIKSYEAKIRELENAYDQAELCGGYCGKYETFENITAHILSAEKILRITRDIDAKLAVA